MRLSTFFRDRPYSSFSQTSIPSMVQSLRGLKAFVTLLLDPRGSLTPVWELSRSLVDSCAFELAVASLKATPTVAALLSERYLAPSHDLETLQHYPKGSLGYVYAHHMQWFELQPLQPAIAVDSDTRYVEARWQQTHDIWHVITGFDTSPIGEIGLQAFYLAQFQLPLASLLIANALIRVTLLQPEALNALMSEIARGWEMGQAAKPLIAQKWEEAWDKPVVVWRRELNVYPNRI
ncbi:Coq4 family protein [Trichocoleus sp. FACHB-262]|uniref:Coq4 family protein n=1 Tax=Trichocoleus sp. FACHB-262 TaxID=2692869 RepID=UPI0016840C52|nr:Coq4 family protein [Trichocoleus sp. FACHB-262]MBD2122333.1 ubiquinone biosynthesis protein [Trichocoleus sp. FACHB-262]